jgi:hypothetical protein
MSCDQRVNSGARSDALSFSGTTLSVFRLAPGTSSLPFSRVGEGKRSEPPGRCTVPTGGSLLKMSTAHYLARIPLDSCNTAVNPSLLTIHRNNPGSPGFVDDEH